MLYRFFGLFVFCVVLNVDAQAQGQGPENTTPWDEKNSPLWFSSNYNYHFETLPLTGTLDHRPWPDTYWPSYQGGIAKRWKNWGNGFGYTFYTKEQLMQMSLEDRDQLSPAEKYDIMMGRYDFPTVKAEWARVSPDDEGWEGLCHGWAAASLEFAQPKPVTRLNPDGIEIRFGSSDVKALLIYLYGVKLSQRRQSMTYFAGGRCNEKEFSRVSADIVRTSTGRVKSVKIPKVYYDWMARGIRPEMSECDDLNAGTFHVILTNQIGILKQGFVGDFDAGFQVWNHPVFAYQTTVDEDSIRVTDRVEQSFGVVKKVIVTTTVEYATESGPDWEPVLSEWNKSNRTYHYSLDLNANGEILGGDWLSESRPDFLWRQTMISDLRSVDRILAGLYEPLSP